MVVDELIGQVTHELSTRVYKDRKQTVFAPMVEEGIKDIKGVKGLFRDVRPYFWDLVSVCQLSLLEIY
jgi:hypothetical protein